MKNNLMIMMICCLSIQLNVVAYDREGFMSTAQREEAYHVGFWDDAALTYSAEEYQRTNDVDDAFLTYRDEEKQHLGVTDEARFTQARESVARDTDNR